MIAVAVALHVLLALAMVAVYCAAGLWVLSLIRLPWTIPSRPAPRDPPRHAAPKPRVANDNQFYPPLRLAA